MAEKKAKKKFEWRQFLPILFMMLIGLVCGLYIGKYIAVVRHTKSISEIFLLIAELLLSFYLAIYLQIIFHEAGHWLFGRITGYRFCSFRIGSFMWIKDGGKIRFCWLKLSGTGGQCLMTPPEMQEGRIPYVLYNLGGSLINLLSAAVFTGVALLTKSIPVVSTLFILLALVGAGYALTNGIPMRFGTINNDGYNALSLGKDPQALRSFWIQLKSNELGSKGMRVKDMPEEWFEIPSPEAMKNSLTAALGVLACNRMMDNKEFDKAAQTMRELLNMDTGIVGLHRSLLMSDLVYCELIGENRQEKLDEMLSKKQMQFMKAMKKFPTILRTQYAYALLSEKNTAKAEQYKSAFEKIAKTYPSPGDIISERELMAYAEHKIY